MGIHVCLYVCPGPCEHVFSGQTHKARTAYVPAGTRDLIGGPHYTLLGCSEDQGHYTPRGWQE